MTKGASPDGVNIVFADRNDDNIVRQHVTDATPAEGLPLSKTLGGSAQIMDAIVETAFIRQARGKGETAREQKSVSAHRIVASR